MRFLSCLTLTFVLFAPLTANGATSIAGHWFGGGVASGMRFTSDLVLIPTGTYTELITVYSPVSGVIKTQRMGNWGWLSNGRLRLTVTNWEPKQQCLAPSGCFPIRKPPGSAYLVRYTSATTAIFTDVTFGKASGTVNYRRAR